MREIILDTETTGLEHKTGDRVIEIGCIEIYNRTPTGREFHTFINPERDVPPGAQAVHGLSAAFLKDKPVFAKIAKEFLEFIEGDTLVIHNASFDVGFLNAELGLIGLMPIAMDRVVDTLAIARRKFPAGPNNLDALCKRFSIDLSKRTKHGALIDCLLLAEVYVELLGERQAALGLQSRDSVTNTAAERKGRRTETKVRPAALPSRLSPETAAAHAAYIAELGPKAVWLKYWTPDES